jgi:hypothetical protein
MRVVSLPLGRLGNAIFRYLATVIFHIVYGAKIIDHSQIKPTDKYLNVTDDVFVEWMDNLLVKGLKLEFEDITYGFNGYFQHDAIYVKYRQQIIDYIRNNPYDMLITDGKTEQRQDYDYFPEQYPSGYLLNPPGEFDKYYDTVVHLRLEDFIENGQVIHPESMKKLFETLKAPTYCIVVNNPKTDLELNYLEYLKKYFSIVIESNDIITDFHIMKNAKTLVCSCSTISWSAAFFSDTIQHLYMPDYYTTRVHETFRQPIPNTTFYYYKSCSKYELR